MPTPPTDQPIATFIADRSPIAFGPQDRVAGAVAAMKEHRSDCVLVTESDAVRGIFTQRDFLNRVAVVGESDGALASVMTAEPSVMRTDDGILAALHKMAVGNYRNVPVVDDGGRALASLTVWDVLKYLGEGFASEASALHKVGTETLRAMSPRPAVEVNASDSLLNTLNLMVQRACGAVRVNDGDRLVGIFAERDLMWRVDYSNTAWHDIPVSEVMTPEPVCIDRSASIAEAVSLMNERGFRHIPLLGDGPDEYPSLVSDRAILAFVAARA